MLLRLCLLATLSITGCAKTRSPNGGDGDSDGDIDADSDADSDADGDSDGDADGDGDSDADADADADTDADADADADGDADAELVCDGLDDDGDGQIDEGNPESGVFCDSGLVGDCALGRTACVGGAVVCDPDTDPSPETCANGQADDDCNGVMDDVIEVGQPCDTGALGVCGVGAQACSGADLVCLSIREAGAEICGNLNDEDCDGEVDEVGCIDRTDVLLCGGSGRDTTAFLPAGRDLTLVNGCVPDDQTQAMLISRGGAAMFDAQGLRDYIDGGGVVITEWNASATIFNAAFEENVVLGGWQGDCYDNVQPSVQLSPLDRFWIDNDFVAVAADREGCGYDMSQYPDIVPIGGWTADTVQIAYRDRGLGRVWLVEADWQDTEVAFTAESVALMQYMVGWTP